MRLICSSILAIFTALLSGCYQVPHYSGEGQLIDNGPSAETDRYVLNLGSIDLTQRGKKSFRTVDLPKAKFVTGIEISIALKDQNIIEEKRIKPSVSLELSDSAGRVLFEKKSTLDTWTWSIVAKSRNAFIYGKGDPGTFFDAQQGEYVLTINIIDPDPSQSKYSAVLIAKSSGWK
jgi:hypothetical protein